jgi:heme/copper-type cytochrome/quinol oxidase subunit 2
MSFCLKRVSIFIILFSLFLPLLSFGVQLPNPLEAETIEELIEDLINLIFWIAIALVPLMVLIAGFFFLTAAGDPEKIKNAKTIIFWTIVGATIALLAKGIISVIKQILGG